MKSALSYSDPAPSAIPSSRWPNWYTPQAAMATWASEQAAREQQVDHRAAEERRRREVREQ